MMDFLQKPISVSDTMPLQSFSLNSSASLPKAVLTCLSSSASHLNLLNLIYIIISTLLQNSFRHTHFSHIRPQIFCTILLSKVNSCLSFTWWWSMFAFLCGLVLLKFYKGCFFLIYFSPAKSNIYLLLIFVFKHKLGF